MATVERHEVETFPADAWDFLLEQEARESLPIALIIRLQADPTAYGESNHFAVGREGDAVVGIGLRTGDMNLILSRLEGQTACDAIAEEFARTFGSLPGVVLQPVSATAFLAAWRERTGQVGRLALSERSMEAGSVIRPDVEGMLLRASREDIDLLAEWYDAFEIEALPSGTPSPDNRAMLEKRIDEPHIGPYLWIVDGKPVSVATVAGTTPNGARIGGVYTPPDLRNRGYGSAVTAAVTEKMLRAHLFCFLETDAANPTSNRIYERMGYRFVSDRSMYLFDPA